jgi:hypothetical protein
MPTGLFALERGFGTITPTYLPVNSYIMQGNPAPNGPLGGGYSASNPWVSKDLPPFPIYNFVYSNNGTSDNGILQIWKYQNIQ